MSADATALTFSTTIKVSAQATRAFNTLALLLLPVLAAIGLIGIVGNAFVCVAIATDRRLHNVTNYFLFSLALADLLVCSVVMPLSIVVEVRHGVWTWSFSMCLLYVYSDVLLCSASIVHMSVISLDRYLGISQPLKTRNKSKTMIIVKISLVWIITVLISCPLAVIALHDPSNVLRDNSCMIFNGYYMIYGSTLSFLIPFFIMTITYVRTTNLLNKQAKILSEKSAEGGPDGLRRTMPNHRKLGYCRTNSGIMRNGSKKEGANAHSPLLRYASMGEPETETLLTKGQRKKNRIDKWKDRTSNYLQALATKVSKRNSLQEASQEIANEHKATRVLAVVFICFFICWTPFFIANFLLGFCGEKCSIPPWMGSLFLWLGYISSTINPLIYTVFNKRFRQAFVRILRCQCFHSIRDPYSFYSRHTTILPETYYTFSNTERGTSREENGTGIRRDAVCMGTPSQLTSNLSTGLSVPNETTANGSVKGNGGQFSYGERVNGTARRKSVEHPLTLQHIPPNMKNQTVRIRKSLTTTTMPTTSIEANEVCPLRRRRMSDSMEISTDSSDIVTPGFILFSSVFSRPVKETFL